MRRTLGAARKTVYAAQRSNAFVLVQDSSTLFGRCLVTPTPIKTLNIGLGTLKID